MPPNEENRRYLAAKRDKLGHVLHHQGLTFGAGHDDQAQISTNAA
jgi:hypothetical protein